MGATGLRYAAGRFLLAAATVWVVATATFFLMRAVPGGPFDREKPLPEPVRENLAARYRLDRPLGAQYLAYLDAVARLDLGPSYSYPGHSVGEILRNGLRVSAPLGGLALLTALALGTLTGVISARHPGGRVDRGATLLVAVVLSVPNYVVGILLIHIFSLRLHWLPAARWGTPAHAVLPALALAAPLAAYVSRLVRAGLREALEEDYVLAARARGLPPGAALWRHALPNALLPLAGYLAPLAVFTLTGTFAVEKLFALPGLGNEVVRSLQERDYNVLMGITVVTSVLVVAASLAADLLQALLDPRLRAGPGAGER